MTRVFCNGTFDMLHVGHLAFLEFARKQGDSLTVGVNTDASVARRKPNRPIIKEADRMLMLRALRCVDVVWFFEDDTPLALVKELKPDVYVVGADYDTDCASCRYVFGYGGKVVKFQKRLESTSGIISRVEQAVQDESMERVKEWTYATLQEIWAAKSPAKNPLATNSKWATVDNEPPPQKSVKAFTDF